MHSLYIGWLLGFPSPWTVIITKQLCRTYPLVNVYIALENGLYRCQKPALPIKITSYVKLPYP